MRNNLLRKPYPVGLISLFLVILSVLLVVLIHGNHGYQSQAPAVSPFYLLRPDHVEEELTGDDAGIRKTYTYTLPDIQTGAAGLRLMAFLRHTYADVTVEDTEFRYTVRESEKPHIGRTPGKMWLNIPVRAEFSGKTLRLVLTPVYDNTLSNDPELMIIERDTLLTTIELPRDGLLLVLGFLAVVAGLLLALMILFIPLERREKALMFLIGMTTVMAGLWKLSDLPVIFLLLDNLGIQKEIWFGGSVCYVLMLVFSLGKMTFLVDENRSSTWKACFFVGAGAAAILLVLQMLCILELHQAVIWFGIGIAFLHLFALLKQKAGLSEWLWVLPSFLTLVLDLGIKLLTGSSRLSSVFLIWTILNLFVRGFGFVRRAVLRERILRQREKELHEAKLRNLMNQIRPHFIYNTLTAIYVLCGEDAEKAARVTSDFMEYLQGNFSAISATEMISFENELSYTKAYLAVMSALYEDKFTVEYDIQADAFCLLPLTLQPLVENAVKYGVSGGCVPCRVIVRTRNVSGGTEMVVEDNGPGFDPALIGEEGHVELRNVRDRLDLMCAGKLTIAPRKEGGTIVTVFIPAPSRA